MKKTHLKRAAALVLAALMAGTALAGCGGSSGSGSAASGEEKKGDASKGKVYYLNFKPEQDEAWQNLAKEYTKAKGVEVTVKTAAEGTYEQTLTSEMNKDTGKRSRRTCQMGRILRRPYKFRDCKEFNKRRLCTQRGRQNQGYRLCNRDLWYHLQQNSPSEVL